MTEPIVKETNRVSYVYRFLFGLKKRVVKRVTNDLNSTILKIEGSYSHLEELNNEDALLLLKDTKSIIKNLDSLNDRLDKNNYFDDNELREKFRYFNASMYKFESILHMVSYKELPVLKTSEEVKDGISKINRRNFSKLSY